MSLNRQQGPAVLLVAVIACSVVLALQHQGFFARLSADWLEGQPMQPWQYAFHTALAFISATVCAGMRQQGRGLLFLGAVMFLTGTLSMVLKMRGFAFEPLSGWLAAALGGMGGLWIAGSERGSRIRDFREFFVGRLREDVFAQLVVDREPAKLAGQREISTLWCQIVNLPALCEKLQANDLEQITSMFGQEAGEHLVRAGGYLESCGPDGVVAHFGFPVLRSDHAAQSCTAALSLRKSLEDLMASFEQRWSTVVEFGIGLSSGKVTCGLIGYEAFQSYRLIGGTVEHAEQLCELNAKYGSRVLISAQTRKLTEDSVEVRPVEMLTPRGSQSPSEVYELLAAREELSAEQTAARDAFWKGVVALRGGQKKAALGHFESARLNGQADRPLEFFLRKAKADA